MNMNYATESDGSAAFNEKSWSEQAPALRFYHFLGFVAFIILVGVILL